MTSTEPVGELLSLRQAAQYIGVGLTTIEKWVDRGYLIPYVLPDGRLRRFKRTEIDELLGNLDPYIGKSPR